MIKQSALVLVLILLCSEASLYAQEFPADTRPFVNLAYKIKGSDDYLPVGSGTIISRDGLVITNEHVYNLSSAPEDVREQLDLSVAYVLYDHDNNRHTPPEPRYVADKLAYWFSGFPGEPDYDVAAMRIARDLDTGTPIAHADFPFIPLGNPFDLPDNATITILGFPSVGGKNLSISSGPWISYQEGNPLGIPDGAILTTAAIWPGNSGGAALYNGRLIGLPTSQASAEVDAGYIHPITWASPLLGFVEYRLGVPTPNIDERWVNTDRNRDLWTRTRSTFMAYVHTDGDDRPVEGATVLIYPAEQSFEDVQRLYAARSQAPPYVVEQDGHLQYAVTTSSRDGFFETWIEKGRRFTVSVVKPGFAPYHATGIQATGHVVQWMRTPFLLSPPTGFTATSTTTAQSFRLTPDAPAPFDLSLQQFQGHSMTNLSYAGGLWAATLSRVATYTDQVYATETTYDEIRDAIRAQWDQGYYITDLARGPGQWMVAMTKGTGFTGQIYRYAGDFPGEWIDEQWKEAYRITNATFGDGTWVIVMSKGTGWGAQSWATRNSYEDIRTYIRERWEAGYAITDLAYGGGKWLAVMTKESGYYEQSYRYATSPDDLNQVIETLWQEGKQLFDITFDDGGWWVLFSKGSVR